MIVYTNADNLLLPMSDARNGYDLLTDVIQAIRDEPRRFDMDDWVLSPRSVIDKRPNEADRPACGTIACVGGWIMTMRGKSYSEIYMSSSASNMALYLLLGEHTDVAPEHYEDWTHARYAFRNLFGDTVPDPIYDVSFTDDEGVLHTPWHYPEAGTQEYADQYADKIRDLQTQYADVLRARTW